MTFGQFWSLILKQWKLILICFLIVGLGTYIGSKLITPLYQSTALVQVAIRSGNNQADYNSLLASDQLVQTEASLAISDPVLREVASHYPGLTVQQLANAVTSTVKLNTQLFQIDVVHASPARAAVLANDIAATLIRQQLQVIQQENTQSQQQVQQDLEMTGQNIDATTSQISALQAKGGNQARVAVLQVQLNGLQQHYSQWQTLLAQLELTQAQNGDFLRIAQSAQPGISPVRPNVLLNTVAGLVAGLFLGLLLAMLFEQLDTRVRTPTAVNQLLEWPVLATVWRTNTSNMEDVINPKGNDANVEAYRILRTNIGFSAIDKSVHSMQVTSACPGDGKSAIAANLAIFMAKAGKSTLLIDADLRRPTQHKLFSLPADSLGLSNALLVSSMQVSPYAPSRPYYSSTPSKNQSPDVVNSNRLLLQSFVHMVGIPNLWVMPSGPLPPNPSELLDSKTMQRFQEILEKCGIDVVIFDTPPLLGLSDSTILASKVDGVLVVIDMTRANKGKLKQVKAILAQASANVLGCVINKERKSRNDSAYTYYYYAPERDDERKLARNGNKPAETVAQSSSRPSS